jgi:hypothetical protein
LSEGFAGIIDQLEKQKAAIEKALAALRDVDGSVTTVPDPPETDEPPVNRRSEAQRARWAEKKAAEVVPAARKGGMTEDGRRRLAEAMKRRWAVKRAAVKRRGRPKKAA